MNNIFNALSIGLQYTLSFKQRDFDSLLQKRQKFSLKIQG